MCKSTCTSQCKIEKVHIFTHFWSKSTHSSPSILLCISIIALVTVYMYTVTIAFYLIFFFKKKSFSLSSLILFSLFLYSLSPLSSLESNNKFTQIIKFFKFILNLDPKFIKTSPQKKKKKNH